MKQEAVDRIKEMLTPKITIGSCYDSPGGITAEVKHEYYYPEGGELPICWAKIITVKADEEGNVYSAEGLF